jgi:hypothetical protein
VATYSLNTPGPVDRIEGILSQSDFKEENETIELALVLTDDQGNLVEDSDQELTLEIEGPAQVLGLESGDLASHERYQASVRKTYQGRLKAFIKTTGNSSAIKIRVTSPNLAEANFKIEKHD